MSHFLTFSAQDPDDDSRFITILEADGADLLERLITDSRK
jgi:hypothetical protein